MTISRRSFLRSGLAVAATQILPSVAFASIEEPIFDLFASSAVANNGPLGPSSAWASKTSAEIMADINALLMQSYSDWKSNPPQPVLADISA